MKIQLDLELRDVYGGDGEIRYEPKEEVKLKRSRTKTMVRESIGLVVNQTVEEETVEEKMEPVNTFRVENGDFVLRLGGSHGKLWGAMKAAAKQLYSLGDKDFRTYKPIMEMISVQPVWVPLPVNGDLRTEGLFQLMSGRATGVTLYYDVVPKTEVSMEVEFPNAIKGKVDKILERIQKMSCLNKRRATIKIINREVVS